MKCLNCSIEFEGRKDAKFCSPKCRVTFSRKQSVVTDNVTFNESDVTDNFSFRVAGDKDKKVREEKYWYDIPIAAIPIIKKDWPEMPDWMNGRQYFLWWKNDFKVNENPDKGELGMPIIHNPYPERDNVTYYAAAEGSRRWGL